jgi:hypothetical protein
MRRKLITVNLWKEWREKNISKHHRGIISANRHLFPLPAIFLVSNFPHRYTVICTTFNDDNQVLKQREDEITIQVRGLLGDATIESIKKMEDDSVELMDTDC